MTETPKELWDELRIIIIGKKTVALKKVEQNMKGLVFNKDMEDYLVKFDSAIKEYQDLGGGQLESELLNRVLDQIPESAGYEGSKLNLQRKANKSNNGELIMKNMKEELRLAASLKPLNSKGAVGNPFKKKGKYAFKGKVTQKRQGKCQNCGKQGHWKRDCTNKGKC